MKWRSITLATLMLLAIGLCVAGERMIDPLVEQPRAFGYTVGDLLVQRIDLGTGKNALVPADMPRIGRVNPSLWRRRSAVQIDHADRHWLMVEYQLINTPQSLTVWYLPSMLIKTTTANALLAVHSAPFSVGPFTPPQAFEQAALPVMQPDGVVVPIDVTAITTRLRLFGSALLATLLVWASLLGWRTVRRTRHLPFAQALQSLPAESQALYLRLHHALNATAGQVMRPDLLPTLLEKAPYFAAEQIGIAQFLQASRAHFFGSDAPPDRAQVLLLMQRLRRLERRHTT